MRVVYRYNVMYVFDSEMDSKGLFYPRAMMHLIIGLYVAQVCLVGLFALNFAFIPMGLVLAFLVFTVIVHYTLSEAIEPLLHNLPQTLALEEEVQMQERLAHEQRQEAAQSHADGQEGGGAANSYYDTEQAFGEQEEEFSDDDNDEHDPSPNTRAVEGASGVKSAITEWIKSSAKSKIELEVEKSGLTRLFERVDRFFGGNPHEPPGLVRRFLHPEIYEDFIALRKMIALDDASEDENSDGTRDETMHNYWPPELWMPKPSLWIPRDEARVSRQEVAHTKKVTPITDKGVDMDDKGRFTMDFDAAPFNKRRWVY